MSGQQAVPPQDELAYAFRPSLLGAVWEFRLGEHGIDWAAGTKSGHLPYRAVRRVRMSFRPANMQTYRFMTEIWGLDTPKLRIVSSSWKSAVEQERLDRPYTALIAELHRRLLLAAPPAHYEQGANPLLYWPGVAAFVLVLLALAALVVRALQAQAMGGAAFIAGFLALFVWQGGNYFRRNRPRPYRPDRLPGEVMPKI